MASALQTAQPFVCGGSAAMFASSIVHPIDLAKVRLQLFALQYPGQPRPSFPELITSMVKKEGISSVMFKHCVLMCMLIYLYRHSKPIETYFQHHYLKSKDV
jgi:hypothetical protein